MENNDIIEKALHGRQVFLTGVTGMLGTSLILKMIRDTTVSAFHVLVRGGEGTRLRTRWFFRTDRMF
jgi:hypothetical protein